jgi:hypothetical protein
LEQLLSTAKAVSGTLPGSDASKAKERRKLYGMFLEFGLPLLFVTVSPGEVYHRVWAYFAGFEVSMDMKADPKMPSIKERQREVAGNPAAQSRFFHRFYTLFLKCFFGWDKSKAGQPYFEGVFGRLTSVKAMVELQERGGPHAHAVATAFGNVLPDDWLARVRDPKDGLKARMVRFIDGVTSQLRQLRADVLLGQQQTPVIEQDCEFCTQMVEAELLQRRFMTPSARHTWRPNSASVASNNAPLAASRCVSRLLWCSV